MRCAQLPIGQRPTNLLWNLTLKAATIDAYVTADTRSPEQVSSHWLDFRVTALLGCRIPTKARASRNFAARGTAWLASNAAMAQGSLEDDLA